MLSINDLRIGTIFLYKNAPYRILEAKHVFMGRGSSTLQAKIKSLITGNVLSQSFKASDAFEEAEIERRNIVYLYHHRGEFWFREVDDSAKRFFFTQEFLGESAKFLKPNHPVKAIVFEEKIVAIELAIKIDFKVKEAPPGDRTDAAQRSTKLITLENGTQIKAPLFINAGDVVRVNTETGEYVERIQKA